MNKILLLILVCVSINTSAQMNTNDDVLISKAKNERQNEKNRERIESIRIKREKEIRFEKDEEIRLKKENEIKLLSLEKWKYTQDSIRVINKKINDSILMDKYIKDSIIKITNHLCIKRLLLNKDLDSSRIILDITLSKFPDDPKLLADEEVWSSLYKIYSDSVNVVKEQNFHKNYRRYYGYKGAPFLSLLLPGAGDILVDGKFKIGHELVMASYVTLVSGAILSHIAADKNYASYLNSNNLKDMNKYYNNSISLDYTTTACVVTASCVLLTDFIRVSVKNSINKKRLQNNMIKHNVEVPERYKNDKHYTSLIINSNKEQREYNHAYKTPTEKKDNQELIIALCYILIPIIAGTIIHSSLQ